MPSPASGGRGMVQWIGWTGRVKIIQIHPHRDRYTGITKSWMERS
jgi:hypothetical protein